MLATVPFLLLASIPFWDWLYSVAPRIGRAFAALLVVYGAVCSLYVGIRFATDPRMEAVAWMRDTLRVPLRSNRLRMHPCGRSNPASMYTMFACRALSGRLRLFAETFPDRPEILARNLELDPEDVSVVQPAALKARSPDMVAVTSLDYARYDTRLGQLYPEMRSFYSGLLAGELGYRPVFDRKSGPAPRLLYPQTIDFLDNRIVVMERAPGRLSNDVRSQTLKSPAGDAKPRADARLVFEPPPNHECGRGRATCAGSAANLSSAACRPARRRTASTARGGFRWTAGELPVRGARGGCGVCRGRR